MKSLLVIVVGLVGSWYFSDLSSENAWRSLVSPLGVFIFLVAFCMWLVAKAGFGAKASPERSHWWWFGGDDGCD